MGSISIVPRPSTKELELNDVKLEDARYRAMKSLDAWIS